MYCLFNISHCFSVSVYVMPVSFLSWFLSISVYVLLVPFLSLFLKILCPLQTHGFGCPPPWLSWASFLNWLPLSNTDIRGRRTLLYTTILRNSKGRISMPRCVLRVWSWSYIFIINWRSIGDVINTTQAAFTSYNTSWYSVSCRDMIVPGDSWLKLINYLGAKVNFDDAGRQLTETPITWELRSILALIQLAETPIGWELS